MSEQDSGASYLRPYELALAAHGASFEATLWGSETAQHLRFDVMIAHAGFAGATIVDAGCGQGDFAAHLLSRDVPFSSYVGLDALGPMVERAQARGMARSSFETADFVRDPAVFPRLSPDWVCFSGTLNTMDDAMARGVVQRAFEAAHQGVVFNFLSDRPAAKWRDRDLTPARRFDTAGWLDWSLSLTPLVSFDQTYLDGHDATIVLRH
ncbi:MAG: class I SAM-dependent methyltransferase [Phycisphaerales bacterium]|nr:class I SAM-dependent methyltransferase [Phycisphaerales bacterium]